MVFLYRMESGNGVPAEEERNGVIEIENGDVKKVEIVGENEEKVDELPNSSSVEGDVSKCKALTHSKSSGKGSSKTHGVAKDEAGVKDSASSKPRAKRTSLTHSVSFPTKGINSGVMSTSADVHPKKAGSKQSQVENGDSGVMKSAHAGKNGATGRRTTLTSPMNGFGQPMVILLPLRTYHLSFCHSLPIYMLSLTNHNASFLVVTFFFFALQNQSDKSLSANGTEALEG